jgi:hypothetical protein
LLIPEAELHPPQALHYQNVIDAVAHELHTRICGSSVGQREHRVE